MYQTQDGIREYEAANHDYLQQQIGNPDGADKPNKKYYDPRMCLRSAEEATVERLGAARRLKSHFRLLMTPYAPSTRRLRDGVALALTQWSILAQESTCMGSGACL